jgi:hypothetical protein
LSTSFEIVTAKNFTSTPPPKKKERKKERNAFLHGAIYKCTPSAFTFAPFAFILPFSFSFPLSLLFLSFSHFVPLFIFFSLPKQHWLIFPPYFPIYIPLQQLYNSGVTSNYAFSLSWRRKILEPHKFTEFW